MNIQRYAVEFDRQSIGIAMTVPGGFMFYASDPRFDELDGQPFPRVASIEGRLRKLVRQKRGPSRSSSMISPSVVIPQSPESSNA